MRRINFFISWLMLATFSFLPLQAQVGETRMSPSDLDKSLEPKDYERNNRFLLYFSKINDLQAIQSMLEENNVLSRTLNLNIQDNLGRTPLFYAVKNGNEALVRYLLTKGADPSVRNAEGDNILHAAVKLGYQGVVQALLRVPKETNGETPTPDELPSPVEEFPEEEFFEEETPEQFTREKPQYVPNPLMISVTDLINTKNNNGDTPLLLAAGLNYNIILFTLLENGGMPYIKNNQGYTPLMLTASGGNLTGTQYLLEFMTELNGDLDQQDNQGNTALMFASYKGYLSIVNLLVSAGAYVNIKNHSGNTSLIFGSRQGYVDIVASLLTAANLDINIKNNNGETALIEAGKEGYSDIVFLLIDSGATVNVKDNRGYNALLWSSYFGFIDVVDILLQIANLQINVRDIYGNTPLILATAQNNYAMVRILLSYGAAMQLRNEDGVTALEIAENREFKEVADLLQFFEFQNNRNIALNSLNSTATNFEPLE